MSSGGGLGTPAGLREEVTVVLSVLVLHPPVLDGVGKFLVWCILCCQVHQ